MVPSARVTLKARIGSSRSPGMISVRPGGSRSTRSRGVPARHRDLDEDAAAAQQELGTQPLAELLAGLERVRAGPLSRSTSGVLDLVVSLSSSWNGRAATLPAMASIALKTQTIRS
jgi:hypothetical protein